MIGRNLWLALGVAVGVVAWGLTVWITHVDHRPQPIITVTFDERPPFQFNRIPLGFASLERERHRFPEAALTGKARAIFFVTPATRSIAISGVKPSDISCGAFPESGEVDAALFVGGDRDAELTPIAGEASNGGILIPVPDPLRRALAARRDERGAISCTFLRPLADAPTFTERAMTIRAESGAGGGVLVDISALEDIDDLRFSGGLQAPLAGDRTRLLYGGNNVVSVEWVDGTAQERRDIVLVLIGALSAIAAATIIEGIRPAVERRSKR